MTGSKNNERSAGSIRNDMKIVLHAFGDKLSGVMEIPEDTGTRFRLAMTQPIQAFNDGRSKHDMMQAPIHKVATFEWTGQVYSEDGHRYDGARIYQLTSLD